MDGILLINKPKDYTSHDIVAIVKKITKEKVGHTGTLDPNATGVLPLLIGKATEISKYLINHDKTYIATLKLGIKTDTADAEGKIISEKEVKDLNIEKVKKVLEEIIGKHEQIPPMYSAIKIKGKKLYEYARMGKSVAVEPRKIEIYNTKLLDFDKKENEIVFKIECSKGTYIRTVCEEIAEKLDTVGFMKELERIKVGEFLIDQTVGIDDIRKNEDIINEKIITLESFFNNKESIILEESKLKLFLNGVLLEQDKTNGTYKIYSSYNFIGTGIIENKKLKRDIII